MLKTAASLSRLGTESAFEVLARAQALMAQGKDIINLGIGQPDFKTPAHIVEAGIQALRALLEKALAIAAAFTVGHGGTLYLGIGTGAPMLLYQSTNSLRQ